MKDRQERDPKTYKAAVFLSSCSEAEVRQWLEARKTDISSVMGTPNTPKNSHLIEYVLYRRNSKYIDLALAEHGRSRTVLERVYAKRRGGIRVVACSNPSLFVGDEFETRSRWTRDKNLLWDIISAGPVQELRAVCENPQISSGFYPALISAWEGDEESKKKIHQIPSDKFRLILGFLGNNPRTSTPREESAERHYMDGSADYHYNLFFSKCWELAEKVPVTDEWADVLYKLYSKLHVPYNVFKNLDEVLERWRPKDKVEEKNDLTIWLRAAIAEKFLKPTLEQLNSPDPALRWAFYRTFDPRKPEFKELDWMEWAKRDEYCWNELEGNERVWMTAHGRRKLERLLWDLSRENSDLVYVGWNKERAERLKELHPEWFKDEEDRWDDDEKETSKPDLTEQVGALSYQSAQMQVALGKMSSKLKILLWASVIILILCLARL